MDKIRRSELAEEAQQGPTNIEEALREFIVYVKVFIRLHSILLPDKITEETISVILDGGFQLEQMEEVFQLIN